MALLQGTVSVVVSVSMFVSAPLCLCSCVWGCLVLLRLVKESHGGNIVSQSPAFDYQGRTRRAVNSFNHFLLDMASVAW